MSRTKAGGAASIVLVLLLAGQARADGFLVPSGREHPVRGPWAVKEHRVRIVADGHRAKTEVRQTFVNLTNGPLEVTYLFPVPEGAMIESFGLVVAGREMPGRILPADEAMAIDESRVDEEIVQFSPRHFELVRSRRSAENRWLSFKESVRVEIDGRIIRIVPPEGR